MAGKIVVIAADGKRSEERYASAVPGYTRISAHVGGHIQLVPHGVKLEGVTRDAFCDEDGGARGLLVNRAATQLWLDQLGEGPFWYTPQLLGTVVVDVPDDASGWCEECGKHNCGADHTPERQSDEDFRAMWEAEHRRTTHCGGDV